MGLPQPTNPLVPFFTVESPMMYRVGTRGAAEGGFAARDLSAGTTRARLASATQACAVCFGASIEVSFRRNAKRSGRLLSPRGFVHYSLRLMASSHPGMQAMSTV